jgi:hypothetical protein
MVKLAKALLTFLACILVACAVAPMPRVVTVVEPYVSMLPLDPEKNPGLDGRVLCDLMGYPVIFVRLGLSAAQTRAIVVHEKVHAQQAFAHRGGCRGLREEMSRDSMFRLSMEATAFCATLSAQKALREEQDPDYQEIFTILSEKYHAAYEPEAVRSAMVMCGG